MKDILHLNHVKAKEFFLEPKRYCSIALPNYISFNTALDLAKSELRNGLSKAEQNKAKLYDDINFQLLQGKDGKFGYRKLNIIHPWFYVAIVDILTKKTSWELIKTRFALFQADSRFEIGSIPLINEGPKKDTSLAIEKWWLDFEQRSIELALNFEFMITTDISGCYSSVYTHAIEWAIHDKEIVKSSLSESKNRLGGKVDNLIRNMQNGQSIGIPQGSVLMDFIAELILGYIDYLLSERIVELGYSELEFKIIRFRDDYRIFAKSTEILSLLSKELTSLLLDFNFNLSKEKTFRTDNIIQNSIKPDKIPWLYNIPEGVNLQKKLLAIHQFSMEFPNSGSLISGLQEIITKLEEGGNFQNVTVLISIVTDILFMNPKATPQCCALISYFLNDLEDPDIRFEYLQKILSKLRRLPETSYLNIWIDRITFKLFLDKDDLNIYTPDELTFFHSPWNSSWLDKETTNKINKLNLIDMKELEAMREIILSKEISLFGYL